MRYDSAEVTKLRGMIATLSDEKASLRAALAEKEKEIDTQSKKWVEHVAVLHDKLAAQAQEIKTLREERDLGLYLHNVACPACRELYDKFAAKERIISELKEKIGDLLLNPMRLGKGETLYAILDECRDDARRLILPAPQPAQGHTANCAVDCHNPTCAPSKPVQGQEKP